MSDANRLLLDAALREFLKSIKDEYETNLYFQPPESIKLKYPCIIYEYSRPDIIYANNNPYNVAQRYDVTIIDKDPESEIVRKFYTFGPTVAYSTNLINDNLHHTVFTLYFNKRGG